MQGLSPQVQKLLYFIQHFNLYQTKHFVFSLEAEACIHKSGNLAGHNYFLQVPPTNTAQQFLHCFVRGGILQRCFLKPLMFSIKISHF